MNLVTSTDSKCNEFRFWRHLRWRTHPVAASFRWIYQDFKRPAVEILPQFSFQSTVHYSAMTRTAGFEDTSWTGFTYQNEGNRWEEKSRQFAGRSEILWIYAALQNYWQGPNSTYKEKELNSHKYTCALIYVCGGVRKIAKSMFVSPSVCPSLRPSVCPHGRTLLILEGLSWDLIIIRKSVEKIKVL